MTNEAWTWELMGEGGTNAESTRRQEDQYHEVTNHLESIRTKANNRNDKHTTARANPNTARTMGKRKGVQDSTLDCYGFSQRIEENTARADHAGVKQSTRSRGYEETRYEERDLSDGTRGA